MARHTSSQHPTAQRAVMALATAGAALGACAATAQAAPAAPVVDVPWRPTSLARTDPQAGLAALRGTVGHVTGTVAGLKPNPLAGTGVDPLDNGVGTQVADFKPVGSQMLTGPLAEAPSVGSMPVAGQALGALDGAGR